MIVPSPVRHARPAGDEVHEESAQRDEQQEEEDPERLGEATEVTVAEHVEERLGQDEEVSDEEEDLEREPVGRTGSMGLPFLGLCCVVSVGVAGDLADHAVPAVSAVVDPLLHRDSLFLGDFSRVGRDTCRPPTLQYSAPPVLRSSNCRGSHPASRPTSPVHGGLRAAGCCPRRTGYHDLPIVELFNFRRMVTSGCGN